MDIISRIYNMIVAMPYGLEKMLSLMDIEESTSVKTACVPIGGRPRIVVNPEYVESHCETDHKLFMLIQHELHHVLLGHTRLFKRVTPQHNIAFDAIINAMLCRSRPEPEWTALFRDSYSTNTFPYCLLRPPKNFPDEPQFPNGMPQSIQSVIRTLYYSNEGTFFDVFELLIKEVVLIVKGGAKADGESDTDAGENGEGGFAICVDADVLEDLLGNHDEDQRGLEDQDDPDLFDIVREIVGEWPQPPNPIAGRSLDSLIRTVTYKTPVVRHPVVKQIIQAVVRSVKMRGNEKGGIPSYETEVYQQFMPSRDRRAFAMHQVGGMVPIYTAEVSKEVFTRNEVSVYVDVSGSMADYPKHLLTALATVQKRIQVRVFVFSTVVKELKPEALRRTEYDTTQGTNGNMVWQHIQDNKFPSVVVLTDGYLGQVQSSFSNLKRDCNLQVLLTPDGGDRDVVCIASGIETLKSL